MYKKPRHLFIKKLYFGFFQTIKAYIYIYAIYNIYNIYMDIYIWI